MLFNHVELDFFLWQWNYIRVFLGIALILLVVLINWLYKTLKKKQSFSKKILISILVLQCILILPTIYVIESYKSDYINKVQPTIERLIKEKRSYGSDEAYYGERFPTIFFYLFNLTMPLVNLSICSILLRINQKRKKYS